MLAESSYLACLTDYSISSPPNQPRETYARLLAAEIGARVPGDLLEEQGADIKILKKDTALLKQNARSMLSMLEGICEKLQVSIPQAEEETKETHEDLSHDFSPMKKTRNCSMRTVSETQSDEDSTSSSAGFRPLHARHAHKICRIAVINHVC